MSSTVSDQKPDIVPKERKDSTRVWVIRNEEIVEIVKEEEKKEES